mgnify:CR=1 FL=1
MGRLRKAFERYRRKWGLFGLLFPIVGFACGIALLWVSLYYGAGFDLWAWMASRMAAPVWLILLIIGVGFVAMWCGA